MEEHSIVHDIYQQFIDYFGEDKVDLQPFVNDKYGIHIYDGVGEGQTIIVYWPEVTVTNEENESIVIWDLYSITLIKPDGRLMCKPHFNRSTYDKVQWNSSYMHSHVHSIPKNQLDAFQYSCFGSGPIGNTVKRLKMQDYNDMNVWKLYCWELDKYVHVESLIGRPYNRLRYVGSKGGEHSSQFRLIRESPEIKREYIKHIFVKYIIQRLAAENILRYSYSKGHYKLGMSFTEAVLTISDNFIKWYNNDEVIRTAATINDLTNYGIISKVKFNGESFFTKNEENASIEAYIGTPILTFKGKDIKLKEKNNTNAYVLSDILIVRLDLISIILMTILKYINLKYGRTEETNTPTEKIRII